MLLIDGADDAILGYANALEGAVVIYDYDELVQVFMRQGMEHRDAVEWVEFNVEAAYLGVGTPLLLRRADRDTIDAIADGEES